MNNEQIIAEIAVQIYGEEAVRKMLENGTEIPLHTVQGWKLRSGGKLKIKKGEHGIACRLWKKKNCKKSEETKEDSKDTDEGNPTDRDFYLCKSYLFRADQVEEVQP